MEEKEKIRYHQNQLDNFLRRMSLKEFVRYVMFYLYYKVFRRYKIVPASKGFRYVLSDNKMTNKVRDFICQYENKSVKYILISVLWDENMRFEIKNDRLKGGPLYDQNEFESLKRYVRCLDDYAVKTGKIKFILASKKAVDWDRFIKSEFVDLRDFESNGFCLSQMLYICQELSSATINWPSTFSIWITNCSGILHLTWMDNKDTSKWARNQLHRRPIGALLEKIDAT